MLSPPDDDDRGLLVLVSSIVRGVPIPADISLDLGLLQRHLVAPLAYRAGRPELRPLYVTAAMHAERRAMLLAEVVRALAGIPALRLKGIAYIESIYGDGALRPMTDIDLLVPARRFGEAVERLHALGYRDDGKRNQRSSANHAVTFRRRESAVDLHRSMMQSGRLRRPLEQVWEAATRLPDGTFLPAPEHQYLFHLAHMARHEFSIPLISLIDADRLVGRLGSPPDVAAWGLGRAHDLLTRYLDAFRNQRLLEPMVFPGTLELIRGERPPRWLQVLRKLAVHDDVPGVVRFAGASLRTRLGV